MGNHSTGRFRFLLRSDDVWRRVLRVVLPAGLALAATAAQAAYPDRPLTLIVPFPPGGTSDIAARMAAARYSEILGQPIIVENKGGAASALGTGEGAHAAPDGYTLTLTNAGAYTTLQSLGQKLNYRPIEDFAQIGMIGLFSNGLVVRADHPAKTFQQFIELARASGKYSYASAGIGSAGFLNGELLKQKAGFEMQHIPYKGTGPAMADLLGGHIDALFNNLSTASEQARAGKVRILAMGGKKRMSLYPDVPTMSESLPGINSESWFGFAVPAATPKPIVDKLVAAMQQMVHEPAFQAKVRNAGMEPSQMTPPEIVQFIRDETAKWAAVIKTAGITKQ